MVPCRRPLLSVVVATTVFVGPSVHAQVASPVQLEAAANLVGQATSEDEIRSEVVGSLDLFADVGVGPISIHAYMEGNGELFDLDAPGKGAFVAGRFRWEADGWEGSAGAWTSTADRRSDIDAAPLPTHGLYSVLGISSGVHSLNGRIGLAMGDEGSEPFLGLTYLGTVGANALGVGLSKTPALPSFGGADRGTRGGIPPAEHPGPRIPDQLRAAPEPGLLPRRAGVR